MGAHHVILILTMVMPGQTPDVIVKIPQDTVAECWVDAKEFVDRGLTNGMKATGGVAVMAACLRIPEDGEGDL